MKRFRFFSLFLVFVTLSASTAFGAALPLKASRSDYALLFATDAYVYWQNLDTPIADAKAIGEELQNQYGFDVDTRTNLTIKQILAALAEYKQKKYATGAQLLVYFNGHGHFDETLQDGYIAGIESEPPEVDKNLTTYLSFSKLRADLDAFPCTNIMLILDVCYGGTFDEERGLDAAQSLDNLMKPLDLSVADPDKKTRWYLSSGRTEAVQDGIEHSPFASALLQILRDIPLDIGGGTQILLLADHRLTIPEIEFALSINKFWKENPYLKVEVISTPSYPIRKGVVEDLAENPDLEIKLTAASGPFGNSEPTDKAFVFHKMPVVSKSIRDVFRKSK